MTWLHRNIQWLMIVSGVLTLTMLYAVVAPAAALQSTFGESVEGPVADVVVRNWGALIGLMGVMLIYGARQPALRLFVLTITGTSKAIFVGLVLMHGARFLGSQAGVAIAVDALWVLLFAAYVVAPPKAAPLGRSSVASV